MKKRQIKIIMVSHASMSFFLKDSNKTLKKFIIDDWFSLTAMQIKKFYPEIEIECWCPERSYKKQKEFVHEGMRYRQFPTSFSPVYALDFSMQMINELKKEIKKNKERDIETIIHLHEYHNLHGLVIASLFGKQRIIAQHHGGSWPLKHIMQNKSYKFLFPLFLLGQFWENLVLKNISYFYALSPEEIKYLKNIAPNSCIKFQTMGVDGKYFVNMSKYTARKKLNLAQKSKMIVFLGRINYVKGVFYLIKAMKRLKDIELKIIGYGPQKDEFERYAQSNKIENVKFLGPIFGDEKFLFLSASDALVLPSLKEGAPVTIMEAFARNRPVVASNVGGVRLMVKENENGIIIPQKNVAELISGIKKVLTIKNKNIINQAKIYEWKKISDETIKDYLNERFI